MATEKQLLANRLNAAKSNGPLTDAGKARSALNATRHSMLARSVVLRCESAERFRAFTENFHQEYRPKTATEITLVNTMASARWRLIRMSHVEASNVDFEYVKQIEPAVVPEDLETADRAGLAYRDLIRNSRVIDTVGRMEGRLQRQFDSALGRLLKMRAARGAVQDEGCQDSDELEHEAL
jgi:hypothetical protein